jgi:hypothetical protein
MRIVRRFTLHEVMDILAQHMGGAYLRSYSFDCQRGMVAVVEVECETYPEHAPRSAAMDWCAREATRSKPATPNYGAAMWAGIRKAELLRQAMDDERREREARLRAAEHHLKPLGSFAAGNILAALREVAR